MGDSAMSAYSSVARSPLSMRRLMMSVGRGSCPCQVSKPPSGLSDPVTSMKRFYHMTAHMLDSLKYWQLHISCASWHLPSIV